MTSHGETLTQLTALYAWLKYGNTSFYVLISNLGKLGLLLIRTYWHSRGAYCGYSKISTISLSFLISLAIFVTSSCIEAGEARRGSIASGLSLDDLVQRES